MNNRPPLSRAISLLGRAHRQSVFNRRVRVLARLLSGHIPNGASVLDIGCGDGTIATGIMECAPSLTLHGIEFAPRKDCRIECQPFDGGTIPYPADSFDVCIFVDVLHHVGEPQGILRLLAEARRVTRQFVLVKDHISENWFDFKTLQFMDWVGNRPHGVVLPYNYQSRAQWNQSFRDAGLAVKNWQANIPIYPAPFSGVFGRQLHFIALLEKQ